MPKMRNLSVSEKELPFNNYTVIRDDFQDLEEKILYLLEDNRYKQQAENCYNDYEDNHKPDKYFETYYKKMIKYAKL